ncbi:MAG: hypothetical protein IKH95_02325 [Bacteroidaceae bacterium]|jgi:hypothetical protein|nr:hypothetical protein [Bacteroidaceae bacterium]
MVDEFFQQEAEDDLKTIEFIRNYLPAEVKERFSDEKGNFNDELIQYFLDVIWEYYYNTFSDTNEEVEIDTELVANHVVKVAKKEKMGEYDPEDVLFVVLGELEYAESLEENS